MKYPVNHAVWGTLQQFLIAFTEISLSDHLKTSVIVISRIVQWIFDAKCTRNRLSAWLMTDPLEELRALPWPVRLWGASEKGGGRERGGKGKRGRRGRKGGDWWEGKRGQNWRKGRTTRSLLYAPWSEILYLPCLCLLLTVDTLKILFETLHNLSDIFLWQAFH